MDCRGCQPLYQVLCRRSFIWIPGAAGHCIRTLAAEVVFLWIAGATGQSMHQVLCGRRGFLWIPGAVGYCIRSFAPQFSMACRSCRPLYQVPCGCSSFLWIAGVAGHCVRFFAAVVFYGLQGLSANVLGPSWLS